MGWLGLYLTCLNHSCYDDHSKILALLLFRFVPQVNYLPLKPIEEATVSTSRLGCGLSSSSYHPPPLLHSHPFQFPNTRQERIEGGEAVDVIRILSAD